MACTTTAKGSTKGSAIALTPDDSRLVAVNRDAGSVTVMSIDYSDGQPKMMVVSELAVGGEPRQVAIDGCGTTAYVVLRKDQRVVRIDSIDGTPAVGASVQVGSEPTSLALSPNNGSLYVSNWVDGTVSVVDPVAMTVKSTVDLNATLVATGLLGTVSPRAARAHPRAIAITNNGDATERDETIYVTEWFAQRIAPESAMGTSAVHRDEPRVGLHEWCVHPHLRPRLGLRIWRSSRCVQRRDGPVRRDPDQLQDDDASGGEHRRHHEWDGDDDGPRRALSSEERGAHAAASDGHRVHQRLRIRLGHGGGRGLSSRRHERRDQRRRRRKPVYRPSTSRRTCAASPAASARS